jgi:hypothetical protein
MLGAVSGDGSCAACGSLRRSISRPLDELVVEHHATQRDGSGATEDYEPARDVRSFSSSRELVQQHSRKSPEHADQQDVADQVYASDPSRRRAAVSHWNVPGLRLDQ